ncbi:hypothetical protein B0T10DRAFT_572553 [Thelonectria olida]|uniref:Aminoglycoside phosphotransferase domain-containing protein n=1 Tax=Thelonectria olida TaxID=1576542 RepID=A0A9P8W4H6_9HYPO|nr:hypothetical protein B0T10DRAFT_572553 [Thelonectria olida]
MADTDPTYTQPDDYYHPDNRAKFGPLLEIPDQRLISVARKVRDHYFARQTPANARVEVESRYAGSKYLIHVIRFEESGTVTKQVIRIPATGWGSRWTREEHNHLEETARRQIHLKNVLEMPVPVILDCTAHCANDINAPFIAETCCRGESLSFAWSKEHPAIPLEERRFESLRSLAQAMKALSRYTHANLECVRSERANPMSILRLTRRRSEITLSDRRKGADRMIGRLVRQLLPLVRCAGDFVLRKQSLDLKDVFVNEMGTVTGIVDWDGATPFPRCLGTIRPPSWICMDWDPALVKLSMSSELPSSAVMQQWREYYYGCYLGDGSAQDDPAGEHRWCHAAHIYELIWEAYMQPSQRVAACQVITNRVNRSDVRVSSRRELESIHASVEPDWSVLDAGLAELTNQAGYV